MPLAVADDHAEDRLLTAVPGSTDLPDKVRQGRNPFLVNLDHQIAFPQTSRHSGLWNGNHHQSLDGTPDAVSGGQGTRQIGKRDAKPLDQQLLGRAVRYLAGQFQPDVPTLGSKSVLAVRNPDVARSVQHATLDVELHGSDRAARG